MLEITTKADALVKKYNMLSNGDFVVVGVSGGADSMALLAYLCQKKQEYDLRLLVANVEHGIRGEESISDTAFVERYCNENNIEFKSISIDAVNGAKQNNMSVEEYSRKVRYDFFRSFNPDKIATAHNLSDNVETLLFRLSRGTSIKGLCGIPPVRDNIIRPFLSVTGEEIRSACKNAGIEYRIDSTNADNKYSRNNIRNNIIPLFKTLNPSFDQSVSRLIESVSEDEAYLNDSANACFDDCFKNNCLSLSRLRSYSASVIKRAILKYFELYGISLDENHLNGVFALVFNPGRLQIKGNTFAISDKKRLRTAVFEQKISFDELTVNKKVISREEFLIKYELLRKEFDFYCDYDKICGNISIRCRDEGDTISPANRNCTKTLKKLFNELRINIEDRDSIPLICDEKGVIGVYGYCIDERVSIDSDTVNVVLINIHLED